MQDINRRLNEVDVKMEAIKRRMQEHAKRQAEWAARWMSRFQDVTDDVARQGVLDAEKRMMEQRQAAEQRVLAREMSEAIARQVEINRQMNEQLHQEQERGLIKAKDTLHELLAKERQDLYKLIDKADNETGSRIDHWIATGSQLHRMVQNHQAQTSNQFVVNEPGLVTDAAGFGYLNVTTTPLIK